MEQTDDKKRNLEIPLDEFETSIQVLDIITKSGFDFDLNVRQYYSPKYGTKWNASGQFPGTCFSNGQSASLQPQLALDGIFEYAAPNDKRTKKQKKNLKIAKQLYRLIEKSGDFSISLEKGIWKISTPLCTATYKTFEDLVENYLRTIEPSMKYRSIRRQDPIW